MSDTESLRVLHLSTHNEECGIARYQEQFLDAMSQDGRVYNEFFEVSPNVSRYMNGAEYDKVIKKLQDKLKSYDILHIQHELSFYKHEELRRVITLAHQMHKKVIVTVHTAFDVEYQAARLPGIGMRSVLHYLRSLKAQRKFEEVHIKPLLEADLLVVHNQVTYQSLVSLGFAAEKIKVIRIPVPKVSAATSTEIKEALDYKKGDVLLSTVGFITRTKGVDQAVKALTFLPDNYKLAIIGGLHPKGGAEDFLDEITDYIDAHKLTDRVYITGFVEDDERLNALIRETDICLYPYDKRYYSYVSSAALNNGFANHRALIAYPTGSILEINDDRRYVVVCSSANYYELAREVRSADVAKQQELAKQYADRYTYSKVAIVLLAIYRDLVVAA